MGGLQEKDGLVRKRVSLLVPFEVTHLSLVIDDGLLPVALCPNHPTP